MPEEPAGPPNAFGPAARGRGWNRWKAGSSCNRLRRYQRERHRAREPSPGHHQLRRDQPGYAQHHQLRHRQRHIEDDRPACYLGTDASGTSPLGNRFGVIVYNGASNNEIGSKTYSALNVIEFNRQSGVEILGGATGNLIVFDYIAQNGTPGETWRE